MCHPPRPLRAWASRSRSLVVAALATALVSTLASACGGQTVSGGDGNGGGTGPTSDGGNPPTSDGGSPPIPVEDSGGPIGTCNVVQIIPPIILVQDAETGAPICDAVLVDNDAGDNLSPVTCPSGSGCSHVVCEYTVFGYGASGSTFSVTVSAPNYNPAVVSGLTTTDCGCDTSQCPAAQMTTVALTHMEGIDAGSPFPDASSPSEGGPISPPPGSTLCPSTEPVSGNVICSGSTLVCEYGISPNPNCNDLYACQGDVWQNITDKSACASPATCPASYGAATGSCSDPYATCQYGAGTCICSNDPEGLPSAGGPAWACIPTTMGCPVDRPLLGSPCTSGSPEDCDYGQCIGGIGETCVDGYWEEANTECPA